MTVRSLLDDIGDNGQGAVAYALAHETTHFIKDFSAAKYEAYAELIIAAAENKGISYDSLLARQMARLSEMEEYKGLSETELQEIAYDETIAEMSETILTDTDAANRFSQEIYKQDRTLWQKIKDFFTGLVEKLRNAYKDSDPDSDIGRILKQAVRDNEQIAQAWAEAVSEAGENYQLQDGQKKNAQEGVRFSSRSSATQYDYSKSFEEQVDDYKKGLIPKGDTLLVGKTPDVFLGIGMNALPVTINTTHVDYALNGTKDFDHHLGEALLNQLPEAIKKPVAIMTSGTKNGSSVVAMLEVRHNGKQVIMPVAIDGFGKQNGIVIDSNAITSIYGKNNSISRVLSDAITQENDGQFRLFYLNENKAAALLQEARVPMPKNPVSHDGGFIHSITDSNSPVKQKIGNVTESQQFKRWFGDWQNDPENASKVVNKDGTPKVMYHGTSAEFTVFDRSKGKKKIHLNVFGDGNYFTALESGATRYGQNVVAAYLDIKNPYVKSSEYNTVADQMANDFGLDRTTYTGKDVSSILKARGYDGVFMLDGNGEVVIANAFDSNQIKSATDNVGTFDKSNPDIRYSDRNSQSKRVERLEKKNAELKAEAEYLKQVVKIQKSGNKAHILDRNSVNAIGKGLMESVNAKGSEFGKPCSVISPPKKNRCILRQEMVYLS